jgi:hypothetical protein
MSALQAASPITSDGHSLARPQRLRPFQILTAALFLLIGLSFHPIEANAACSNPAGAAGKMIYNSDWRVVQYCNNTIWVQAGMAIYNPVAVTFDGANDYLSRSANMTADNGKVSGSFWFRRNATGQQTIYRVQRSTTYSAARLRFIIEFTSADKLHIQGQSADSTNQVNLITTPAYTDTNWHHVLYSIDVASGTSACGIYVDGASVALGTSTCNSSTFIDFTPTSTANHTIGAGSDSSVSGNKFNGDLADFWLDVGTALTLSTDKGKFITTAGAPVHTGSSGTTPTGAAVDILLSGALASWHTNDAAGGGFTLNGGGLDASPYSIVEAGFASAAGGGQDVSSGLIHKWTFDNTLNDAVGTANGTFLNSATYTSGLIGSKALSVPGAFDGVDVALNNMPGMNDPVTITAWVYPTASDSYYFFSLDDTVNLKAVEMSVGNCSFGCGIHLNAYGGGTIVDGNFGYMSLNHWYHVAYTWDGTTNRLYRDGFEQANSTVVHASNASNEIVIGRNAWGYGFKGVLDDVRMYDHALSDTEIASLAAWRGPACTNPNGMSGTVMYNSTSNVLQYCNGRYWKPMGPVPGTGGSGCSNPAKAKGSVIYNSTSAVMQYCDGTNWRTFGGGVAQGPTAGLVGWWKFDEGSGGTSADSSGNGNAMTMSASWSTGHLGNAVSSAGSDWERAETSSATGLPNIQASKSISLWFNSTASSNGGILAQISGGTSLIDVGVSPGAPNIWANSYGGANLITCWPGSISQNAWHHLMYTYDGTTHTLYLDGAVACTSTTSGNSGAPTGVVVANGENMTTSEFEGKVDDVRIYNRALNAGELQQLYYATGGQ